MEINGKNYELVYGLRPMFIFEEMAGKPFELTTLLDTYIFFYACIIANKDNPKIEFNDFIDYCDTHIDALEEYNKFLQEKMSERELLGDKKKVTEGEKK